MAFFPFTFSHGSGDGEPRRLVSLTNIIGNLTNILPAFSLCHIVQGQHLRIGAINSRMLEQTNNTGVTRQPVAEHRSSKSNSIHHIGIAYLENKGQAWQGNPLPPGHTAELERHTHVQQIPRSWKEGDSPRPHLRQQLHRAPPVSLYPAPTVSVICGCCSSWGDPLQTWNS